jgi:hypothetical protein
MAAPRRQDANGLRRQPEAEQIGSQDLSPLESLIVRGVRVVDGDGGSE